jgi:DNA-binding NtrC family response regulator
MAEDPYRVVQHLVREAYRPFTEAAGLVRCFGEALVAAVRSPWAEITVHSREDGAADLRMRFGGPASPRVLPKPFPILYQETELGRLEIAAPGESAGDPVCAWAAKALAHHLQRLAVSRLAREQNGREAWLIGTSEPLSRVDRFLEQASRTSLPALILGPAGSEAERIALALHLLGPAREEPFVQVHCATFESGALDHQLAGLLDAARGGTLLLAHLHEMEPRGQLLLCQILESGLPAWSAGRCGRPAAVRLVATANRGPAGPLESLTGGLVEQLDVLHLELAPLRERREDVRPLIEHSLRQHAHGEPPELAEEVWQACGEYHWPGDVAELSRLVARLAVMAEGRRVLLQHVQAYAPQILDGGAAAPAGASPPGRAQKSGDCHPSLQRALGYMAAHPEAPLSLGEVAAQAYVSRSHLEHLFRSDLATTFTRHLSSLRIDRAKRLLAERPREAITSVAAECGFADLRHFERTFKGAVGCTPREFRRLSGARRPPGR